MLFLGEIPSGYGEYMFIMAVAIITVVLLVVFGGRYIKKSGVIKKDKDGNCNCKKGECQCANCAEHS